MYPAELQVLTMGGSISLNNVKFADPTKNNASSSSEYQCDPPCGEAGCVNFQGVVQCLCADGRELYPPDGTSCKRQLVNPIDPAGTPNKPANWPFVGKQPIIETDSRDKVRTNNRSSLPLVTKETEAIKETNIDSMELIKTIVPITGVLLIVLIVVISILFRRRRLSHSRTPTSESPVSWLHQQDRVMLLDSMPVVSKNPSYFTHSETFLVNVKEKLLPRDKLQLLEEIGEGAFGKVYKGEAKFGEEDAMLVAVKILKEDASRETKEDFKREVEIMSSFEHENILKLLGVVALNGETPYMIFEYMEHGDLTESLRQNDPQANYPEKKVTLRQTDLVDIASQIANGMLYLTSRHFVHRDLATRNCLVGSGLQVKISDFGMSRDIYTCDYYRIGGARMLPVRWMSPQSMKYGLFTPESDVWSYGVVLWEIFTYGKQPYYGHSNEEVIRLLEDGILLQRPAVCPDTIYHVMLGCWRREPKDRFTFERIHRHLMEFSGKMIKCYQEHDIAANIDLHRVEEV